MGRRKRVYGSTETDTEEDVTDEEGSAEYPDDKSTDDTASPEAVSSGTPSVSSEDEKDANAAKEHSVPEVKKKTEGIPIYSPSHANRTIIASSGLPVFFDGEGNAEVNAVDAEYLKICEGFEVET